MACSLSMDMRDWRRDFRVFGDINASLSVSSFGKRDESADLPLGNEVMLV
jgi:hypothetical protein